MIQQISFAENELTNYYYKRETNTAHQYQQLKILERMLENVEFEERDELQLDSGKFICYQRFSEQN
uniref:Uncharacterized protein n=1 Tax=Onchocerca volvulus TaxID=6282 RepID=A0A8R1TZF6_ONCVO